MQDSGVLQAASSHGAWEAAIVELIRGGMQRDDADNYLKERYWHLTRVLDSLYQILTYNILTFGLWGRVKLECADWQLGTSLIMLVFKPSRHWVHLLSPCGLSARDLAQWPYHISICYMQDLWDDWNNKRHQLYHLERLYSTEVEVNIPIASFGSGASALIHNDCDIYRQLYPLWRSGSESYKSGLHISL